ncbi:MAG TPA: hypothetical protein VL551_10550 [Actinospica sp.]|nr:hypothetical protein [Actinospica sp.]
MTLARGEKNRLTGLTAHRDLMRHHVRNRAGEQIGLARFGSAGAGTLLALGQPQRRRANSVVTLKGSIRYARCVTVLLTDLLDHLPVPERRVEVHVDAGGAVPCVDLAPRPSSDVRGGPYPRLPIRKAHLDLPDPQQLADFAEHSEEVRDRYLAARSWFRTSGAEVRVAFCMGGEPREVLESVMTEFDQTVGVVTGADTCVLGMSDGYRGRGTGRVITLAVPDTVAAQDHWLIPLAVQTALYDADMAEFENGGMFIAGRHELPDPPPQIDIRIGGQVHRLGVIEVSPGYWPMRPVEAPDARCALFERAWSEVFPGYRCPIGWLQLEMRQRDPDPRHVPGPPFHMTDEQRERFALLWRTTWPLPEALASFPDRPGWQRALDLAEALMAATESEWSREVELLPHLARPRWCENAEALVPITAAAIYTTARQAGMEIDQVPVCAAGQLLTGDWSRALPDGLPLDSRLVLHWREQHGADPRHLRAVRLRAQHILSCPHPGSSPCGVRCVSVRERIEAGSQSGWSHTPVSEVTRLFEDGVGPQTCAECGAPGPWLFARPAHVWWWAWALCRCGNALQISFRQDFGTTDLEWSPASAPELEAHAREQGFGLFDSWTGPVPPTMSHLPTELGRALPTMAAGGDARWREAVRVAARELAAVDPEHPAIPRTTDQGIIGFCLYPALTLAALGLYTLSEQADVAPGLLDVRALLAAGPEELHTRLAAALPDKADLDRRRMTGVWQIRVEDWPGLGPIDPAIHEIDPVPVAWSTLPFPSGTATRSSQMSPPGRFQSGYRLLAALLAPSS